MRPLERIALFRDMVTYGPAVSAGDVLFFLHGLEGSLRAVIAEQKAARDEQLEALRARVAELEGAPDVRKVIAEQRRQRDAGSPELLP